MAFILLTLSTWISVECARWGGPSVGGTSPAVRNKHTGVMDSAGKLWIFGGWGSGSGYLNDVHYLDTQDGTGTPTWVTPSVSGTSPTAREAHTSVMDASGKMWVFGGTDGSAVLDEVHSLDTQAGTPIWTTPSVSGASPSARQRHSAVMDASGKMWVFGGWDGSGYFNDVHYLDTQAGAPTWTTPSPSGTSQQARNGHTAVMDGDGKMWVFGGWGPASGFLNDVHYLDTQAATPTWATPSVSGAPPTAREMMTATMDGSGRMWVFGGNDGTSTLDDVHFLDTQAAMPTWVTPLLTSSSLSGGISARYSHAAAYDGGKMWVFGGYDGGSYLDDVGYLVVEAESVTWADSPLDGVEPVDRYKHTAVMDSNGKMWLFGGYSYSGYLSDVHYLDTQATTPTWTTPSTSGSSPSAREDHSAVMDANQKMWVFGGTDGSNLNDVHYLDTEAATPTWITPSVTGTSPSARKRHTAVMDANGKMWVFGGYSGSYLNDVHYLDTQAGTPTWTTPSVSGNSPETRNRHVSVMDGNGKMWIFGGWGPGNGYLNDVHYLDTQAATPTWTTPSISGTSPTGRERFAAVMDSSGKIWIFGGTDGSRVDELYCLDTQATGAPTWIAPLESGRGPSSRYSLSAVLDSSRRMWLFGGGFGGSSYSNGVYYLVAEAESTTWKTPAVSSASPIGRSEHTAVMDASGRMWIFAGWDGSSRLNDVHYLDTKSAPAAWTTPSLSGSSPSTRDALSAVMDASQKIWIFGGDDGSSFLNDVHYLDTQAATPTWTTPSVAGTNPTARYRHTGVMDASGKMWIFAGIDSSGYLNDVHYLDTQAGTPTWTTPSVSGTSPEIRNRHVAVMDGNGKMWIFGGWGPGNLYLNDVHCLDTQAATPTWTTPSLSGTSPSGREQLTALMDWSGKMWIFGGTDGSRFNELHYLDTKAGTPMWSTPLVSGTIPFVRRAHSAVYDGNGKMWIFGGKTDSGYVNEVYCREVSTTTTTSSSTTSSSTTSSSTTSSSTSTSTSTTATSSSSTSSSTSTSSTSSSASTSTLTSVTKTVTTTTSETTSKTASTTTTVSSSSSSTSVSFSSTTTSSRSTFTSSSLTTSTSSATVITSMSSTISATMTTGTSTVSATASTRISASTTSSTSTTTSTTSITTITITTTCTTTNNATTLSTAASSKVNLGTESYTRLQLREMEEQRQEQARLAVLNLDATESEVVQQVLSNLSNSNDGSTLAFLLEETRVGPTTFAAFSAAFSEAWPDSFTIPAIGGIVEISREVMQEVTSEAKIDGPVLVSITTINEELSAAFRSDEALGLRETYFELRSKLLSVNFWNEEGRRLKVTLMTPITLQLVDVEDENATCAFWDARASRWSKEGMETLPSDPTTLRCNVFHLTTFGAVTNRIARNIELSFQCSTFASLMDESAFSKLSEPKWLQHSSAILSIIFLILSLTAMSIAVWVDWRSKDKLPQHQREILLMRVNAGGRGRGAKKEKDATADDAQQETQQDILEHPTWRQTLRAACGNCMEFLGHATGDNAIEGVKELCANAEAASINKSISMLQSHRSGACQITIKVLEHDESEPVKRSRSRKVSLVRGALSVRQESSVQHQISKADVIYMKSAEVGAGAAEQFLRSNCFGRICALFPAVHAWLKVLRFSVVVSHSVRVMLIAMKIISAGALGALFFSTTEHTPESDPECVEPTDPFDQLVQTATVGLGTAVLGDGIILVFFLVQRRSVVERRRWTAGMKRRQRCCWRFRTMVFWILAISYFCYCQLYIWLFLANVSQESATSWFESLVVTLVQDFLLKPFILALVLGALTTLILCCRPRLKRQVLQKWKPIDEPSESVREDESNNALEEDFREALSDVESLEARVRANSFLLEDATLRFADPEISQLVGQFVIRDGMVSIRF